MTSHFTALEADAGSEDCAICFDPVHAEDRLPLPCRCQLTYCLLCWDRALAAAFNDNGQARCPSCRRPVRVDFDPEAANGRGRLVFSLLSSDDEAAGSSAQARSEMVNRLAEQAAPLMTRLLRHYGEGHPTLRATAQDPARALAARPIEDLRRMLRSLDESSEVHLGVRVTLHSLRGRVDLNGADGVVVEYLEESGRFRVALVTLRMEPLSRWHGALRTTPACCVLRACVLRALLAQLPVRMRNAQRSACAVWCRTAAAGTAPAVDETLAE